MDTIREIANDLASDEDTPEDLESWYSDKVALGQKLHASRSVADTLTAIDQGLNPPEPTSARNKRQRDDRAGPNPSPTKAPAAVRARGGKMTLPRRPSGGLARSPQRGAGITEAAAPRPRRGQRNTGSVPQDADTDIPIATEEPDFDIHVRLLLPQTQTWEQPVLAEVADVEGLSGEARENLQAWFDHYFETHPKFCFPFWLEAAQIDERCMGCKTITKRDSPWDELKIRACQSCIRAARPCLRMALILRGSLYHRELRVLPRNDEDPFGYWRAPPPKPVEEGQSEEGLAE